MDVQSHHEDFLWFAGLFTTWGVEDSVFLRFGEVKNMSEDETNAVLSDLVRYSRLVRRESEEYQEPEGDEEEGTTIRKVFYITKKMA